MIYLINITNIYALLLAIGFYTFSASIIFTNATAGSLNEFKEISGTASALFGTMQTIGAIFSSAIIALYHAKNILPVAIIFINVSLLSLLINYYSKFK